jgi:hypothetical protein
MGERVVHNQDAGLICFPHNGFSVKYDGPTKDFFSWILYSQENQRGGRNQLLVKKFTNQ